MIDYGLRFIAVDARENSKDSEIVSTLKADLDILRMDFQMIHPSFT